MKKQIITKNGKLIQLDNQILAVEVEDTLKKLLTKTKSSQYMFHNQTEITTDEVEAMLSYDSLEDVENAQYMFYNCTYLNKMPNINLKNIKNAEHMFDGCSWISKLPNMDLSNATNTSYMFNECQSLREISPVISAENNEAADYMFQHSNYHGGSLPPVPKTAVTINMPKLTTANYMFWNFYGAEELFLNVPQLKQASRMISGGVKKVTFTGTDLLENAAYMLMGNDLEEIHGLTFNNITSMSHMCDGAYNLHLKVESSSSKITAIESAFLRACAVEKVKIDTGSCTSINATFCCATFLRNVELTTMDKISYSTSNTSEAFAYACSLKYVIIRNMTKIPTINSNMVSNTFCKEEGAGFYVPDDYVDKLKTATNWSSFADKIYPLSTLPDNYDDETYVVCIQPVKGNYSDNPSDSTSKRFYTRDIGGIQSSAKVTIHVGSDTPKRLLKFPIRAYCSTNGHTVDVNIYQPDSTEIYQTINYTNGNSGTLFEPTMDISNLSPGYHTILIEHLEPLNTSGGWNTRVGAYFEGSQE